LKKPKVLMNLLQPVISAWWTYYNFYNNW
jgi:hypothetical protein